MKTRLTKDEMTDGIGLYSPEVRTLGSAEAQLRAVNPTDSSKRYIEGVAVPYGEWQRVGWFMEKFRSGAFTKSINESAIRLPLLLWHQSDQWPIGSAERWEEDDGQLYGVWRINDTEQADTAYGLAQRGDMMGLSVGFAGVRQKWDMAKEFAPEKGEEYMDRVERIEARLLEVSLCATPAYVNAHVSMVRSLDRRPGSQKRRGPTDAEIQAELAALRRTPAV